MTAIFYELYRDLKKKIDMVELFSRRMTLTEDSFKSNIRDIEERVEKLEKSRIEQD